MKGQSSILATNGRLVEAQREWAIRYKKAASSISRAITASTGRAWECSGLNLMRRDEILNG
jgi:hypothetical protein